MIPRVIHCCWFSGERKPALLERCLASWRRFAPDFEIREWDVPALRAAFGGDLPRFAEDALRARKWAFASDWARFALLTKFGGVYLDLDVELIRPIGDLVDEGPFFALSTDSPRWVDPGLGFSAERGDAVCAEIARKYEALAFDPACHLNQTCPEIANAVLARHPGRQCLPAAVFNPKGNCAGRVRITDATRGIHHFAASWFNWRQHLAYKLLPRLGLAPSPRVLGIAAIVASAFGFAVMAACVRLTDDFGASVPCFEKSFFRNFVALLIAAFAFSRSRAGRAALFPDRRSLVPLLLRCVLGTVGIFTNFHALSHIPIADGQTLNKTAPFFTLLFAWMFLGERVRWRQFAAVAFAFVGAALVVKPGFAGADAFPLAMGLLGGICAGGAYAAVRALGKGGMDPSAIVLAFSGFSCLASIPLTLMDFVPLTFAQFLVLTGAGAGAAIGQFGITNAYRFAAPREIAVFDYTNILFTAILGYLLFGQVSDALSILGMAVIVAAAVLEMSSGRKPEKSV